MKVWRISEHPDLTGKGGIHMPGRWNHKGDAIVYCSDHPSTAMLEILVNTDPDILPDDMQLLEIDVPNSIKVEDIEMSENWQVDISYTRNFWKSFCVKSQLAILRVPSIIVPNAWNYLINPNHAESARITISSQIRFDVDKRFSQ